MKTQQRYLPFISSLTLALVLTISVATMSEAGMDVLIPFTSLIFKIVGYPLRFAWVFAFEPFGYFIIAGFWTLIFFMFFICCNKFLKGIPLQISKIIPVVFVFLAISPLVNLSTVEEDTIEACLSGQYAEAKGMPDEGARYCMRARLRAMLFEDSNINPVEFCEQLSSDKIAALEQKENKFLPANTTYRQYCFLSLGLARLDHAQKPNESAEEREASVVTIIQNTCNELFQATQSTQAREQCVDYLQKAKGIYYL